MTEYTALMGVSKYEEAFTFISACTLKALQTAQKQDQIVCLMFDDPNNLGAALICHFLLQTTKAQIKSMKQYSAQKSVELVKERRMQTSIIRP